MLALLLEIAMMFAAEPVYAQLGQLKPAMEALGPYPILQFWAGVFILVFIVAGALLWLRGEKAGKVIREDVELSAPRPPEAAIQLFFGGPLKAIFDQLTVIAGAQALNKLENKDVFAKLLSQSRHTLLDKMAEVRSEVAEEVSKSHAATLDKIGDLQADIASLRDLVIRIDTNMEARRR